MSERRIDTRHPEVRALLAEAVEQIATTAAYSAWDKTGVPIPPVADYTPGSDMMAKHPVAVAEFITGYALEEDTSLTDTLAEGIAAIARRDSAPALLDALEALWRVAITMDNCDEKGLAVMDAAGAILSQHGRLTGEKV